MLLRHLNQRLTPTLISRHFGFKGAKKSGHRTTPKYADVESTLKSWEQQQQNKILSKQQDPEKKLDDRIHEYQSRKLDEFDQKLEESGREQLFADAAENEHDKESILRTWKRRDMSIDNNLFGNDYTLGKEVDTFLERYAKHLTKHSDYFEKSKSDAELRNKTRQVVNQRGLQQPWLADEEINKHHVDYDRYSSYRENYLKMKENMPDDGFMPDNISPREMEGRSIQQFLRKMDPKLVGQGWADTYDSTVTDPMLFTGQETENQPIEQEDEEGTDGEEEGPLTHGREDHADEDSYYDTKYDQYHRRNKKEKKHEEKQDQFDNDSNNLYDSNTDPTEFIEQNYSKWVGLDSQERDIDDEEGLNAPKFSLDAKFDLFENYLKGESIRNLSLKYGILPLRVRCIIWKFQYFVEHILPNASLETIKMAIFIEKEIIEKEVPTVDYGLDLEFMANEQMGVELKTTNFRRIPCNPPPDPNYEQKHEQQLRKAKKPLQEFITEKFIGNTWNGYYLCDMKKYRGNGSERVTKKFRRILENSGHQHDHGVPMNAERKLQKGRSIRDASKGYGIE